MKITGIGEILWDLFPDKKLPGGAPANVIYNTTLLGADSCLVSRVGDDPDGIELVEYLQEKGIKTGYIQVDKIHKTGVVDVSFDDNNDPRYNIVKPAAWDFLEKSESIRLLAAESDAIAFGTLAQRSPVSADTIQWFLKVAGEKCLKVLDVNFRPPYVMEDVVRRSLELADIVKINHEERDALMKMLNTSNPEDVLLNEFNVRGICLTKGMKGSEWIEKDYRIDQSVYKAVDKEGDSVGLGDGFTAVLTVELTKHGDAKKAMDRASRYTALLAGKRGGMPEMKQEDINKIYND